MKKYQMDIDVTLAAVDRMTKPSGWLCNDQRFMSNSRNHIQLIERMILTDVMYHGGGSRSSILHSISINCKETQ
jgi:hypothetical protein